MAAPAPFIMPMLAASFAGSLFSSMIFAGDEPAPMAMETPPASATQQNTAHAAESAAAQAKKRAAGASGRSDTIKTGGGLGELGADNSEKKTLLGY